MAANAYILINVEPASTRTVSERLREISGAVVNEVFGPYDFVVDLEADTPEDITAVLRTKIRPISAVVAACKSRNESPIIIHSLG